MGTISSFISLGNYRRLSLEPFGAISQRALLGMAAVMIIPSLTPFLSLVLPAGANRWMNIVFGALYSLIMMMVIRGGWHYYVLFGLIEITLTVLIIWYVDLAEAANPLIASTTRRASRQFRKVTTAEVHRAVQK
jgi:hypothetical protein